MKFLLAADLPEWHDRSSSRQDQHFRNVLAEAMKQAISQVQTLGAVNGGVSGANWPGVSLHFKLESTPVAKPADEAA